MKVEDPDERRERRAKHMVFGKASSRAEHDRQGIAFWREAPAGDKFQAIVELVGAQCYPSATDGSRPGFDRSAHGIAKLRS